MSPSATPDATLDPGLRPSDPARSNGDPWGELRDIVGLIDFRTAATREVDWHQPVAGGRGRKALVVRVHLGQ